MAATVHWAWASLPEMTAVLLERTHGVLSALDFDHGHTHAETPPIWAAPLPADYAAAR